MTQDCVAGKAGMFAMLFILSSSMTAAASSEAQPLEVHNGHAYVDVRLNDAAAVPFLLDTGAGVSTPIVDESRARALHLSRAGSTTAGAIGGRVPVKFFNGGRLSLGGRMIWQGRVAAIALHAQEAAEGHVVGGILGYSFFADHFVELDYPHRRLRLAGQRIGPNALRLELVGKVPVVEGFLTVGSHQYRVRLRVDTGEDRALVLNGRFLRAHPALVPGGATVTGNALGGVTRTIEGTVDTLRLGSIEQRNVRTAFNIDRAGAIDSNADDGLVGGSFLDRYRVQFDYQHRRMSLTVRGR